MIYEKREISPLEKKAKKTVSRSFLAEDIDVSILQTIPYKYSKKIIDVQLSSQEFSCVCPYSDLPDFACLSIRYTPYKKLIELKSLKYYIYAFRNVKIYNEHLVNKIMEDLKKVLNPRKIEITAEFSCRGGITNKVVATFTKKH
jgi:7-cyano-7-deazaguanine reductase